MLITADIDVMARADVSGAALDGVSHSTTRQLARLDRDSHLTLDESLAISS